MINRCSRVSVLDIIKVVVVISSPPMILHGEFQARRSTEGDGPTRFEKLPPV